MSKMKLSIIVVSYNTRQMTLDCLNSVFTQTSGFDFEVIVFENASVDGSAEAIEEQFPNVVLIKSKENIGFARGNNEAIKQASGDLVLLLNPDTVVLDEAINRLIEFSDEHKAAGIWGGRTLFGDHSLNANSCFRFMSVWNQFCRASGLASVFSKSGFFNAEEYGGWNRDTVRQVDVVCGCFLLISRAAWDHLGGFDLRFFMYAEEADLCARAAKSLGYKPMITPKATIIHYGGASESIRSDKMVRLLAAKAEFMEVHWGWWRRLLGKLCLRGWVVSRIAALSVLRWRSNHYENNLLGWKNILSRTNEWINGYSGR